MNGLQFDNSDRNQWFMTKKKEICSFMYSQLVDGKQKIICKKICDNLESFFDVPLNSVELDIFWVQNYNNTIDLIIDCEFVEFKMFALPFSNGFVFFPIINYRV